MLDSTPIPTYQELLLPTLQALDKLGGSGTRDEIDEAVIGLVPISAEQLAVEYPPEAKQKGSKVIHRLAWSRTYLKKFGVVNNSERGVWTLEPSAREHLDGEPVAASKALQAADSEVRKQNRLAKLASTALSKAEAEEIEAEIAVEEVAEEEASLELEGAYDWTDRLLKRLWDLTPAAFERLTQLLLREAGFKNVEVKGKSGDGGIDGVGLYRPSLISFPIFFQCKRYQGTVGPSFVRDFRGAMAGRGEKGLLITTGTFTSEAKKEANRDGAPPVELIDGPALCELLKEFKVGVTTKLIEAVEIEEDFYTKL